MESVIWQKNITREIELVNCEIHGEQQETFVCCHTVESLKDNQPRGFWWSIEQPENPRPDAWCTDCEELVNQHGAWEGKPEEIANIKVICGACYDTVKSMNVPAKKHWWKFW